MADSIGTSLRIDKDGNNILHIGNDKLVHIAGTLLAIGREDGDEDGDVIITKLFSQEDREIARE
ncbi:hypothetical protein LCGC14_1445300 [marine sediment metagenome]|uniref:Uncharacterized protein n=1 Tax=marine sediment metagenome TaxID=412755 RepID=A0A0F9LZY3_9ZZZZ